MKVLGPGDYREMPWANGRGVTLELYREEGLRLSVATVAEAGPFSALPGIDRVLVLIEGPGFALTIDGVRQAVAPLAPVRFAGEQAVAAVEVAGVSRDFNLMLARGRAAELRVLAPGEEMAGARCFLFALAAAEVEAGGVRQAVPRWAGRITRASAARLGRAGDRHRAFRLIRCAAAGAPRRRAQPAVAGRFFPLSAPRRAAARQPVAGFAWTYEKNGYHRLQKGFCGGRGRANGGV